MKKGSSLMLASVLLLAALAGCSTGEDNSLVSKTPFPEFSEADTEGNPVSSDIFADYDATIVNFWNNGCGTCIEEMPELEELYHQLQERNRNTDILRVTGCISVCIGGGKCKDRSWYCIKDL